MQANPQNKSKQKNNPNQTKSQNKRKQKKKITMKIFKVAHSLLSFAFAWQRGTVLSNDRDWNFYQARGH